MKFFFNSIYALYLCFFILLFTMLFVKNIHFEPLEVGAVTQILHPEYPKGKLAYDPHYHYDYIAAFVAKKFGYENNFVGLTRVFWFLEMTFAILVLIKLCNFVFKNDRVILCIVVMLFIFLKSGETDQKTMAAPLYFLAIYYFLNEKWLISAFFGGLIFYLHVGLAMWWFLPSCFALGVIFFVQRKISLKQIVEYIFITTILASPILYFYLGRTQSPTIDAFAVKYYYYSCWYATSPLLALSNSRWLSSTLPMIGILLVGYNKFRKSGYKNDNIIPIVISVLCLYVLNFIFADILKNGTAITLQLLRSSVSVEFFSALFFAFLLARQIKKGNYVFFFIFILIAFKYNIVSRWLGNIEYYSVLNIFYFVFLIYEIFEKHILNFLESIYRQLAKKINTEDFMKIVNKCNSFLQHPVIIAVLLILLAVPKPLCLKEFIRSNFRIYSYNSTVVRSQNYYLFSDIVNYVDKNIGDNALLLAPFLKNDFEFYTKHKTFINFSTPILGSQYGYDGPKFRRIVESDMNYPLENFFKNYSDGNFSRQWQMLWENLNENIIRRWKKNYGLTHVIREKDLPLKFPVLYQNEFYVIYTID